MYLCRKDRHKGIIEIKLPTSRVVFTAVLRLVKVKFGCKDVCIKMYTDVSPLHSIVGLTQYGLHSRGRKSNANKKYDLSPNVT